VDIVGVSLWADFYKADPGKRSSPNNHSIGVLRGQRGPPCLVLCLDSHGNLIVNLEIQRLFKEPNCVDFTFFQPNDLWVRSIAVLRLKLEIIPVFADEVNGILSDEAVRFENIVPVDDHLRPVRVIEIGRGIVRRVDSRWLILSEVKCG
jgi:hypothetical protein